MKQTSTILISILFSTNVFAGTFIVDINEIESHNDINIISKHVKNKLSSLLLKNGIEENTIRNIFKKAPNGYKKRIEELTYNIQKVFPDINMEQVHKTIMNNILQGNLSMYTEYSEKIGLLQRSYKIALSQEDIKKIAQI